MRHAHIHALAATLVTATFTGCAPDGGADLADTSWQAPRSQEAAESRVAIRIEQAARTLDRGGDAAGARAALEGAARDPAATPEERDLANIERSRALEAAGDREGATAAIEALLGEHADGRPWPMEARAEARLRQLLTGKASAPKPSPRAYAGPPAPFARVIARYFPLENRDGRLSAEVSVLSFGGREEDTKRIGAFDIDRALRDQQREACALCDDVMNIQTASSRSDSWVGIPRHRARLGSSLTVYYMTLGDGRIPARYDADLPMPSEAIARTLEQGKGLVMARERKGAPPSIVIAAPREAQLGTMEEALAAMSALPTEPFTQALPPSLSSEEIQAVVRVGFAQYWACYEARLTQDPTAEGTIKLKFEIKPDGTVASAAVDAATGGLDDAALQQCMVSHTTTFVFPEALAKTDVVYPLQFKNGNELCSGRPCGG